VAHKINVGLIGAGRIGRVHAEHLATRIPAANLVAVTDVVAEAAEKLAGDYQIPAAYQDTRRIMEDPAIEAVVICSSTDTHARMIEEAARAGKHVFCEKPIALDLARIDQALATVDRAGVKLQVGFQRRFDPSFQRAREAVVSGQIGVPNILRITSRDPQPPPIEYVRVCGGIFLDMTIHDFDMARFLMGDEVDEVYAACGVLVDPAIGEAGDVDTAVVTLQFAGGALGAIDNSRRAAYGYDQRVEVFGSQGMVTVSNHAPNAAVISDAGGIHAPLPLHFFIERYTEAYEAEMRAFVECVLHDTPPPVTGRDGRIPVVMGYAAQLSLAEHRPVRLTEVDVIRAA